MDLSTFIADNLLTIHVYLAGLSGNEIWRIEKDEAANVGSAANNVLRHYDVPGLDQKTVDWFRLVQVLGMVYGTRLFAMRMRPSTAPKQQGPQPVEQPKPAAAPTSDPPPRDAPKGMVWASPGPGLPDVLMPRQ